MGKGTLCAICLKGGGRPGMPLCSDHEEEWSLSPEHRRSTKPGIIARVAFDDFVRRRVAEIRNDRIAAAGARS